VLADFATALGFTVTCSVAELRAAAEDLDADRGHP
jgi:hypothetical protein